MRKLFLSHWRKQKEEQPSQSKGQASVNSAPAPATAKEVLPRGFFPMDQYQPEDVFIVGFPKSGNTWFQNLVGAVVHGVNPVWSPVSLVHELVPDVHSETMYRRFATPTYFKSHYLPRPEYRRVVYLLRDGRDAMVSYWHYREALDRTKLDFLEFVKGGQLLFPCRWHHHVTEWMKNPYDAEMIIIKYEDLLKDAATQMERFCEFVGIKRDADFLKAATASADFRNLRKKEEKQGFGRFDHEFPEGKYFFRRGVAGSHKDEMPAEVLAAFMAEARATLRSVGYLRDSIASGLAT